jgi:hypothetical protein
VGRIDQAYGDRHLFCSCPAPSDLAEPTDAADPSNLARVG